MKSSNNLFKRQVKRGVAAVGDKHVNHEGWRMLLIEAAALRFPPAPAQDENAVAERSESEEVELLRRVVLNYVCIVEDVAE